MADKTLAERLQPSLLDRLTDEEPTKETETRDKRVIDIDRLRTILQRDLSNLLNTNNIETLIDVDELPHVANSVLNYGIREVSGTFSTSNRAEAIRQSIMAAVEVFEPRIIPGSVDIELRAEESKGEMLVAYDIRAGMWAQPMPIELYLRSKVDMTSGEVALERG